MLRLLNIELHKLRYNKSVKVISIVYFTLISLMVLIASYEFSFFGTTIHIADQGIFNFPYIWHGNTWMAAWLKIFFAVVIVSIVANEYSYRTLKQNLIDGLSKKEFITSKFLTVLLFAALSTLFVFIVSIILGLIFSDYNEIGIIFSDMQYLFGYFIKLVTFFSFCMFLAIWIKRSAFALGFLGVWWFLEGMIFLAIAFFNRNNDSDIADTICNFLPLNAMADLIVEPVTRLGAIQSIATQMGDSFDKSYDVPWYSLVISIVWTCVFIYWSWVILKRRDL